MRRSGQIITKGKDRWLVRVYLGRDPLSNKRLYESEIIIGRQGDAKARLNEKLAKKDGGQLVKKNDLTLSGYLLDWINSIAKARVREVTLESYKYHLEKYLSDELIATKLIKLRTFDIQKHYNILSANYSPRTVRYVHTILKNALKKSC